MLLLVSFLLKANAVTLQCYFSNGNHAVIGAVYTCRATVTLTGTTSLENVTGSHLAERNHDNVQAVIISDQNIQFIPEGIANFFRNLIALSYVRSPLKPISAKDLQPFPQMKYLQVESGNLCN